jgi:hypothetical protein
MPAEMPFDEALVRRLPLPLAQLYRRAQNAKTPQDRHLAAYFLWEAALKLLGCVAVVAYAERGEGNSDLADCLQNLARPSLGHWWELLRRLTPVLAEAGDPGFVAVRDLVLGRTRDDLPRVAGLDAALLETLERRGGARATVRLTELFDRLVRYRNRELGHGAAGQQPAAFYERMGRALLAGVGQLLDHLDVLAGRQLLYVGDVRKLTADRWLIDRYELRGEAVRRLEALDLPESEATRRLRPEQLYLQLPTLGLQLLVPLAIYDGEMGEVLFLNGRRRRQRIEYLSYNSGRLQERDALADERRHGYTAGTAWRIRAAERAGPRRHGRGLPGLAAVAGPPGRRQAAVPNGRPACRGPLQPRDPRPGPRGASPPGQDLHLRQRGRILVLRHGVGRGCHAGRRPRTPGQGQSPS